MGDDNVLVATDPSGVVAFGARSGRLESLPVWVTTHPSFVVGDVVAVHTATEVHAFTGLPETVAWTSFPLRDTAAAIGTTFRCQLRLGAGSLALLAFGPRAAAGIALPPLGELWLDPAQFVTTLLVPVAGEERALLTVAIPGTPALQGTEWWQQSLVLPPAGAFWLTDPEWLWVL
jgi:hypothetical protein